MAKVLKKLAAMLIILLFTPIFLLYGGNVSAMPPLEPEPPEGGVGGFTFERSDINKNAARGALF